MSPLQSPDHSPSSRTRVIRVMAALLLLATLNACGGSDEDDAADDSIDGVIEDALNQADDADTTDEDDDPPGSQGSLSGLATLIIAGTTYEFFDDTCVAEMGSGLADTTAFSIAGEGIADGQPFGGFIQRSEYDIDGDGIQDVLHTVRIEAGRGDVLEQAEAGSPSLLVQLTETDEGNLSVGYEPGRISGSGALIDRNGVLASETDEILFTFVAACV